MDSRCITPILKVPPTIAPPPGMHTQRYIVAEVDEVRTLPSRCRGTVASLDSQGLPLSKLRTVASPDRVVVEVHSEEELPPLVAESNVVAESKPPTQDRPEVLTRRHEHEGAFFRELAGASDQRPGVVRTQQGTIVDPNAHTRAEPEP